MQKDKPIEPGRQILKKLQKRENPTGWGPRSAILVTLAIYFGAQLIAGYLIAQYLLIRGETRNSIASSLDNSISLQFLFILFAEAFSLLLLWWFLKKRKISWKMIGVKKPSGKNLIYSIPAYFVYFVIILSAFTVVQNFVPDININQSQQVGFDSASGSGPLMLVFLSLVILPAVTEEILVRGFLYGGLRNKLPVITSALIASGIFGLAHLQLGSGNSPVWIAAIDTFILSMVLVWLRERTGNVWAGVLVHMGKNSLAFLSLFIFKSF